MTYHAKTLYRKRINVRIGEETLKFEDYPQLYQVSDSLAVRSEARYYWLVRLKIGLIVAAAIVASVTFSLEPDLAELGGIVLAALLVGSMAFTVIMKIKNYDQIWSDSRAVAEYLKSETWSFMMSVGPYDGKLIGENAKIFLERQRLALQKRPELCAHLTTDFEEAIQISDHMREIKNATFETRKEYYIRNRVRDQRLWYMRKAKWNRKQGDVWFVVGWALEVLAIIFAIIVINQRNLVVNPVGIVTAAGGGVISWINSRSYNEPADSYGFVAQELLLSEEKMKQMDTEEKLAEAVLGVEKITAREHMIWLARLY